MTVKVNANIVIDDTGKIPWGDLVSRPTTLVEIITITGASTYYSATYNGTNTITFNKDKI